MSSARVTQQELERLTDRINALVGQKGGYFELSGAYGGWRLEHITLGGGSCDAMDTGYVSRRALRDAMYVFLRGINAGRASK